jgi:ketosteroid isomerase-like protein
MTTPNDSPSPASTALDLPAVADFCERYRQAWNSHDPARVLALATDDVLWEDPTIPGRRARGHHAVRGWLESLWRAFPDLRFAYLDASDAPGDGVYLTPDRTRVAVPWRCTGTLRGALSPPGFAPTGAPMALDGVDLYSFRGPLVCRVRTLTDMYDAAGQLGLLPAPGSRGERLAVWLQRGLAFAARTVGARPPGR